MRKKEKLCEIYLLLYQKLTELQVNNAFVKTLEKNRSFTYISMPDNYFFRKLVAVVFESGLRATVWIKFELEVKREFSDYNALKVSKYTEKDVERMLANPKMFRNKRKIVACIGNAKKIVEISREYDGFWKWLDENTIKEGKLIFPKPELIQKIRDNFKMVGDTNALAFLRYVGYDLVKPDVNVKRILYRLGLIPHTKNSEENRKRIQEVGVKMANTVGEKVTTIDYLLYLYGSGGVRYIKYPICTKVPRCGECPLAKFCKYFIEVVSNS